MGNILLGLLIFSVLNGILCDSKEKFIRASEHFYVSTESRSFVGAWVDCKTGGMELASVESEEEQRELNNATDAAKYESSDGYWIGGVSEYEGSGTWYWLDSALRIVYTNWGYNQPRYYGSDYRRECIRLGSFYKVNEPYQWENTDCSLQLLYICKAKSSKLKDNN